MKIIKNRFNVYENTFDLEIASENHIYMVTCDKNEIDDIIIDFEIENVEVLNL